jgi:hypothetical protein
MPITDTLKTAAEFRSVGFPQSQADKLAEKFEEIGRAVSEDLKSFISGELDRKLGALEGRINVRFAEQEARFEHSLRIQLATILTALVGVVGLAVAIIKLFPNAH